MTHTLALCPGYGGLELGLGLTPAAYAEFAPAPARVMAAHHPSVPNFGDITAVDWSRVARPDLLTAGFPCQPVSAAGRQLATADPRWLWPAVRACVAALRPTRVLLENVRNIVGIHKGQILALILGDLCALGYAVRWLTLGACAVGFAHHRHRWFALATYVGEPAPPPRHLATHPVCGWRRERAAAPSPTARDGDGRGAGDADYWAQRTSRRGNGLPLDATVALLPTPRATDGENGGPGQRGSSGDLAMPSAVQPQHWGAYAAAVERQEAVTGIPAPAPTEPNTNGNPRLAPAFVEWLMGIPAGHVTATADITRNEALRMLGNGAVPAQVAAAHALLTDGAPAPSWPGTRWSA